MDTEHTPRTRPRPSATFDADSLAEIRRAAATGIYDIRGGGKTNKLRDNDRTKWLGWSSWAGSRGRTRGG